MHRLCFFLVLLAALPSASAAQEVIRSSRYERANMNTKVAEKTVALREKYRLPSGCQVKTPSEGEEVVILVYQHGMEVEESRIIEEKQAPYLFAEKAVEACYFLYNREPVIIGNHAYLFEVSGDTTSLYTVKDGKSSAVGMADGQAYLTRDGYLLKRWTRAGQ
ncbi:MAG: hypothetical protein U0411_09495 [Thermodesulfovibrionales bacterium]